MGFAHLHLHTEYSLLDGACRIKELISAVKAKGQTAVAITDHGVMFGVVDFFKEAKKQGVHPVIGCEVYVAVGAHTGRTHGVDNKYHHLVLLCENQTGYQNLIRLVSLSHTNGFYGKPRVDKQLLEQYHEGLIALSACLAGELPQKILAGDYEGAKQTALWYRNTFGENNYFIELQDHGLEEQTRVLPRLTALAKELGIGLVATNDCHYVEQEDSIMQKTLICIQTGKTLNDKDGFGYDNSDQMYLKTEEEMAELFPRLPEAIENSQKIADRCQVEFTFGVTQLPEFKIPRDHAAFLREMSYEGLHRLYGEHPDPSIIERLEYELDVISRMGYVDYFLIVWDFINYAKKNAIPVGPGRGSGAGSLVAYCIGITGVDPIRYHLIFERFLNPERVSMPDFDIDFCYVRREEVIAYLIEKYGADHVAQIVTFGTLAAKAAIRDVGRVYEIPYATVDKIAKAVPNRIKISLKDALKESPELNEQYETDETVRRIIDMAMKIEGMPRHASTHAAGVVVTRDPVDCYVPLARGEESAVTQFTMTTLEELGLLKIDLLGLRNLTVIDDAVRVIREHQPDFTMEKIPLDDAATYRMLSKGDTGGVFQFESAGMRRVLARLQPTSVEDLTAALALYRPGPLKSIGTYIENRHHPENVEYLTPELEPILKVTYGCLVYQEQVMQVCRELGGFTYGHADVVRRAMSKKKHDVMERERASFVEGAAQRGISAAVANRVFDSMTDFASYAFNKSHAVAYSLVAYQTAYLKCHYPCEYMAALMSSVMGSDKLTEYVGECRMKKIPVVPPDVNRSQKGFSVSNGQVVFGLLAVKNVGLNFIEHLLRNRQENGPFEGFYDFCRRLQGRDLNRRNLESLIQCGALDSLESNRRKMLLSVELVLNALGNDRRGNVEGQIGLFDLPGSRQEFTLPSVEEFDRNALLRMEKETVGIYITGHPLDDYAQLQVQGKQTIGELTADEPSVTDGQSVVVLCSIVGIRTTLTKKNQTMAYLQIEDMSGNMEVLVFPKVYAKFAPLLQTGNVCVIKGRMSTHEERGSQLVCDTVHLPNEFQSEKIAAPAPSRYLGLHLHMDAPQSETEEKCLHLMSIFPGNTPVYIKYRSNGKRMLVPKSRFVAYNEPMVQELIRILGEGNVLYLA